MRASSSLVALLALSLMIPESVFAQTGGVLANGCGPVAVFVAGRAVGSDCSLSDAVRASSWTEGEPVRIRDILAACERLDLSARLARLTPGRLRRFVRGQTRTAILMVDSEPRRTRHVVTVFGVNGNRFVGIDWPAGIVRWDAGELADRWDGACILVAATSAELDAAAPRDVPTRAETVFHIVAAVSALLACAFLLPGLLVRMFSRGMGTRRK